MLKDYVSTFDGTLASLSAPTRTIYLLILKRKTHEDKRYCKKDQFFHSVENWAEASGYSIRTIQYSLKELRDLGIIEWEVRPGRSNLYTHKKYITIYKPKKQSIYCTPPMHQMHPTPAPNAPITTKDLTVKDLTTTHTWLNDQLLNSLIAQYGKEAVDDRVVVISAMNGKIKNKAGLLVDSLRRGYIPTCKELREKEEKERKRNLIDNEIERKRKEQEEREKAWAKSDPNAGKNAIAELMSKLGDVRE